MCAPKGSRSEPAHVRAPTAATVSAAPAVRPTAPTTAASAAINAPRHAPPTTAPATNQLAVTAQRRPRPASASGVTVDSIESPHGDHVERTATAPAVTTASTTTIVTSTPPVGRPG